MRQAVNALDLPVSVCNSVPSDTVQTHINSDFQDHEMTLERLASLRANMQVFKHKHQALTTCK